MSMNPPPSDSEVPSTVSLSDEDAVRGVLVEALLGLWSTVNSLSRLRPSRRERYRVAIFGSARPASDDGVYAEVRDMCATLSEMGCDIVTGGGPGLMQAANEGAGASQKAQGTENIGIRVELPFEQEANPFVEQTYQHQTFFTRLHHFVLVSDAYIVVPGGIGTVLETMMIWQLLQVRHLHDVPLVLAGSMWRGLIDWASRQMLRPGFELANPSDLQIPRCVDTGADAVAIIRDHHARWVADKNSRP